MFQPPWNTNVKHKTQIEMIFLLSINSPISIHSYIIFTSRTNCLSYFIDLLELELLELKKYPIEGQPPEQERSLWSCSSLSEVRAVAVYRSAPCFASYMLDKCRFLASEIIVIKKRRWISSTIYVQKTGMFLLTRWHVTGCSLKPVLG